MIVTLMPIRLDNSCLIIFRLRIETLIKNNWTLLQCSYSINSSLVFHTFKTYWTAEQVKGETLNRPFLNYSCSSDLLLD